jgi:TonB-dependent receptor
MSYMKPKSFLFQAVAAVACIVLLNLSSFSQNTRSLRGKVVDMKTKEPLPGASISIRGMALGASTNLKGEFVLDLVVLDKVELVISYLGYEDKALVVGKDDKSSLTIEMSPANLKNLKEVVVIGSNREGQGKALNQQRVADNIKNVISADLIARFPDLNIADALQRVPGLNVERDRNEGGFIQMRGAPKQFTTININGEQIPGTTTEGIRSEELSVIPVDQLSSIEVTKTITSDMDGDNIGGTVDLKTPLGKSLKWKGKIESSAGYNRIVNNTNFIGRGSINKRFGATEKNKNGVWGINLGGSYLGTNNGRYRSNLTYNSSYTVVNGQNFVLPTSVRHRDLQNFRSRTGVSGSIDFSPNAKNEIFFNFMYSRRFDEDEERHARFDFSGTGWRIRSGKNDPDSNTSTSVRRFTNPRINDVRNFTYTLNGTHRIGNHTLDFIAFASNSENLAFVGRTYDLRSANQRVLVDGLGGDFLNVRLGSGDIHAPALITSVRNFENDDRVITGRNRSLKVNYNIPYKFAGKYNSSFKFGGKYRRMNNKDVTSDTRFAYVSQPSVNQATLFSTYVNTNETTRFMNGNVRFGPTLDYKRFDEFITNNPASWRYDTIVSINNQLPTFYDAQEDVYAGYAMTKVQVKKVMFLAGLRLENTNLKYIGKAFDRDNNDNIKPKTVRDSAYSRNYTFFLPNVQFKYSVNSLTNIRGALTFSYSRPNFPDASPRQSLRLSNLSIDLGNPDLKPARSTNVDFIFERYFKNAGIISAGLFYKGITDFNYQRTYSEVRTFKTLNDVTGIIQDTTNNFNISQTQNGDRARIFGFELNIQKSLDFLPGLLKGFTVYANYTFTDSKANTFDRKGVRLPGQAKHTGNVALSYDYKWLTLRGAFNYNGEIVSELGPAGTNGSSDFDIFRATRTQVDVSASVNLGKGFRVYAEGTNLTNRPDVEFIGKRSNIVNYELYDWVGRFGLSYTF